MSVAFKLSESEAQSTKDCAVLDVDYLNRNTFHDRTLRNEIVGLFLAQIDGVQKTLQTPLEQKAWFFTFHTLKGAAAAVGALQIAAFADEWGRKTAPIGHPQRNLCQKQLDLCVGAFKAVANQL